MNIKSLAKIINNFMRDIKGKLFIYYFSLNKKKIFDKSRLAPINNQLTALMNKYYTDKGNFNNLHNYTKFYHALFQEICSEKLNFFEVGIGSINEQNPFNMKSTDINYVPLASLKAWEEYFYNSEIYGADIDETLVQTTGRIKTFHVDMTKKESIISMWKKINKKMDIIIDDGFHSFEANVNFFKHSIERLNKNGYYIIEDVHRNPNNIKKFYNFFENLNINYQIIDLPHTNNVRDNCLILIRND
jgi:hypothetical protein